MKHKTDPIVCGRSGVDDCSHALSPARAQNAAATYKAKCTGCHGADGKGNTGPGKALGVHDFGSEEVTKMSDADLVKIMTDGKEQNARLWKEPERN